MVYVLTAWLLYIVIHSQTAYLKVY